MFSFHRQAGTFQVIAADMQMPTLVSGRVIFAAPMKIGQTRAEKACGCAASGSTGSSSPLFFACSHQEAEIKIEASIFITSIYNPFTSIYIHLYYFSIYSDDCQYSNLWCK